MSILRTRLARLLSLACLALPASLACIAVPAVSAPSRAEAVWRANCGATQCSASVRTLADRRDAAYGAQLRVSRVAGAAHELVLISPHAQPAPGAALEVQVDGQSIARLAAGADYRPVRSSGTLMIDRATAQRLYPSMRAGKRIAFRFATAGGKDLTLDLSLQGFTAAARKIALTIPKASDLPAPASERSVAPSPKQAAVSASSSSGASSGARATPAPSGRNTAPADGGRAAPPTTADDTTAAAPQRGGPPVLEGPTLPPLEDEEGAASPAAPAMTPPAPMDAQPAPTQGRPRMGEVVLATLRSRGPDDWTRFLPELRPAIDACLERTPGSDLHVTKAWPMIGGLAGVRTRNATVGWFDCVAAQSGNRVERFVAVSKEVGRAPGEDVVVFTRIDGQPPEGKCYRSERVIDDYKETVGWLSRNLCHRDATPSGRR